MNVAVIGLGNAGATLHLPALAAMRDIDVVGAVDLDATRREQAKAKFRVPVFARVDELFASARPDVVCIGTPPGSHAALCLQSLEAGAHVLCEKPFVSSIAQADMVLAAARAAGRRVALNHEFREMPVFKAVRDAVSSGATGGLNFAQVWQQIDLPPSAETGWRGDMRQRTLYEAGVHFVDFLMALFGERPRAVQAWTSTGGVCDGATDAVALLTMEFSRGRLATVTQNRLGKGESQYFEVRADTDRASFRASFGGRARISAGLFRSPRPHVRVEYGIAGLAWKEVGATRSMLARNPKAPNMVATRDVFERSLVAFRDGTEPPASGEFAREVMTVIVAAYHSAATGRRLTIDDALVAELRDVHLG
ncbi:Gfo/Idh/MocA family protein [Gemmatimonas sp.]|uniref:Gfo/Idh/MocA family protein n=1 Tax=Gemmatimonas sp. TaxID=1962908 RepID=UPI003983D771